MVSRQTGYLSNIKLIPATVWAVGFVTLLMNSSTIIIFSLMPVYLTSVMGLSLVALGRYEGSIELTSWIVRIISGPISDIISKRKPVLVIAYSCAAISRIIFPYAPNVESVVFARIIDRIGNGLQASPREALIGDVSPKEIKGSCYGLRQTLGLIGSFLGALVTIYIMTITNNNYIMAFWVAFIPAVLAVLIVAIFVKDAKNNVKKINQSIKQIFSIENIKKLNVNYFRVVIFSTIFMFSYYSGAFAILQAKTAGLSEDKVSLVMVVQNFLGFLMAFPMGMLSDKFGRKQFIVIGCLFNILGNICIAQTGSLTIVMTGIGLWGAQLGMMSGLISTKIAENAPKELRATAFAIYFGITGLTVFISNNIAGYVAQNFGISKVFFVGATFAALAMLFVNILPKSIKD